MKKVLVPLAPGFEEIEAVTVIDILRRAGVDVTVAGTVKGEIEGRNKIRLTPDVLLDAVVAGHFDMIVLPGGSAGTEHLKKDARVRRILYDTAERGGYITAICAAPTVLSAAGLLQGKRVTSYPSAKGELSGTIYSEDRVVVDGLIVTSRSPGTAMEFAVKLVELLEGRTKMEEVSRGVLARI
ncbi:MAG: DJ-1/PfpI family protein [Nitrospirae bacterium]|nr:DJ-1/PfpI family protein [Nitrospirota bacterium]